MGDIYQPNHANGTTPFSRQIGKKADRRLKARGARPQSFWIGLGTMGLIGWSAVVPTLLGVGLGLWLDKLQTAHVWTPIMLVVGLIVGCFNAWHWVSKENEKIRDDREDKNA